MFKVITYLNLIVFHTLDVAEQISDLGFKANSKNKRLVVYQHTEKELLLEGGIILHHFNSGFRV